MTPPLARRVTRPVWPFFVLTVALSVPFWVLGAALPAFLPPELPLNVPTAALMAFMPGCAALILTARQDGLQAARALLRDALDVQRITHPRWFVPALVLMPAVLSITYVMIVLTGRQPAPAVFPVALAPAFFVVFFMAAVGEELGWQGYTYEPLAARHGALTASLGLGIFWALYHVIGLMQADRAPLWIVWHCAGQICLRVLFTWVYLGAGRSLFAVSVFHAMTNVSEYLIPNYGSSYDPIATALLLLVVTVIVCLRWRPGLPSGQLFAPDTSR